MNTDILPACHLTWRRWRPDELPWPKAPQFGIGPKGCASVWLAADMMQVADTVVQLEAIIAEMIEQRRHLIHKHGVLDRIINLERGNVGSDGEAARVRLLIMKMEHVAAPPI